jgi:hypothetical protein
MFFFQNEFVTEQVQEIAKNAIHAALNNAVYTKEKVNSWDDMIAGLSLGG